MPKERLLKVFLEKGDSDRQELIRKILNPKRREQLDKMLLKHDKALKEEDLISLRNTILLVFREFLDETLLKDVDTIAITTAILLNMSYMETYAIKDQHYSEETKSFKATKKKMLQWIETFQSRVLPSPYGIPSELDKFHSLLEQLQYVPIEYTHDDLLKIKRNLLSTIYKSLGLSAAKTQNLVKAVIDYTTWLDNIGEQLAVPSEYEELYHLIKSGSELDHDAIKSLQSMLEQGFLMIDAEEDTYVSTKLKVAALKVLLPEEIIERGLELLRVHSPVDYYIHTVDLSEQGMNAYIEHEAAIFQKYGKHLSPEHIHSIQQAYEIFSTLPTSIEELDQKRSNYIDSFL